MTPSPHKCFLKYYFSYEGDYEEARSQKVVGVLEEWRLSLEYLRVPDCKQLKNIFY